MNFDFMEMDMEKEVIEILEAVRHELSFLSGLMAFDKACEKEAWELDYTELINKIDNVISLSDEKDTRS